MSVPSSPTPACRETEKETRKVNFFLPELGGRGLRGLRRGLTCGMDPYMSVFLCPVFAVCRQKRRRYSMTAGNYQGWGYWWTMGQCPAGLTEDHRGRAGRLGLSLWSMCPSLPPITPRNKIEELQQRKEADLKAQLARTQKLQQELEAANQVRGWVLRSLG